MTVEELARYRVVRSDSGDACFLCLQAIAPDGECLAVPENCEETDKMDAGKPYKYRKAHRACMERVP